MVNSHVYFLIYIVLGRIDHFKILLTITAELNYENGTMGNARDVSNYARYVTSIKIMLI